MNENQQNSASAEDKQRNFQKERENFNRQQRDEKPDLHKVEHPERLDI